MASSLPSGAISNHTQEAYQWFKLFGRLSAVAPDPGEPYKALITVRFPDGRRNFSPQDLFSRCHPFWLDRVPTVEGEVNELKLPYDLLISEEQAREDQHNLRLGQFGVPRDPDGAICTAHIHIPTRGLENSPERQAYWRDRLASLAGKWVRLTVTPQRYNFLTKQEKEGKIVRRIGARLLIVYVEDMEKM